MKNSHTVLLNTIIIDISDSLRKKVDTGGIPAKTKNIKNTIVWELKFKNLKEFM
jgi:hypothetical protein